MSFPFDPFAELARSSRTECRNGLSYKDLAQTAHAVYFTSHGVSPGPLCDADLAPWEDVAAKAASIIDIPPDEQASVEVSAKGLAKTMYIQHTLSKDQVPVWEEVIQESKTAWEAVGRHLANLIDSDGATPNFSELEDRITKWARDRVTAKQLVLS